MSANWPALLWRVVMLIMLSAVIASAENFCALTVNIESPDGRPARKTWVELIDPDGVVEKRELVDGPTVHICDFGFGAYSIRIAPNLCHPITISNLHLHLGHPITLRVRKSECEGEGMHTGCEVFLRVGDKEAKRIAGASILSEGHPWLKTDEFGRAEGLLAAGERQIAVSAEGYQPRLIALKCEEASDLYQQVILEHSR